MDERIAQLEAEIGKIHAVQKEAKAQKHAVAAELDKLYAMRSLAAKLATLSPAERALLKAGPVAAA